MKPEILPTGRAIAAPFHWSIKSRWLLVPLLAITLLLMAACGPTASSAPDSTLSAEAVLEQAREALDSVRSYRFTAELVAEADRDAGVEARRLQWSGEWVAPEWWHIKLESGAEMAWVGNRLFGKNLETRDDAWRDEGTVPYVGSTTPRQPFLDLAEPQVLEDQVIEGVPVFHVAGMLMQEKASTAPEFPTPIHLLIGKEDYLVLRMTIEGYGVRVRATFPGGPPATPERRPSVTYTYDYFDYNEPVVIELPPLDPCARSAETKERLNCDRFTQRVYWLSERLETTDALSLGFDGAFIDYSNEDDLITEESRLTAVYSSPKPAGGRTSIYLQQWSRPAWKKYMARFTGYDPGTGGPKGWWQHPCVEEEVYQELNGAEVHLFKAHLPSLIYIYPMSPEEVNRCLEEPVRAVGAHVYFPDTHSRSSSRL